MKYLSKTCALIVSYNPSIEIIKSIESLAGQVEKIIVVDNASTESNIIENLRLLSSAGTICSVINNQNLGIAAALNQGIAIAMEDGYEWIATFDQDTVIPAEYINDLLNCHNNITSNGDIAIMCPSYINYFSKHELQLHEDEYSYVKSSMTSGSIMKISTLKSIGMFDEQLFIDWVDLDYCMKTRLAKYKIVRSNRTALIHSPGNVKQHLIFGYVVITSDHSPLRRYYLYRNRIIAVKRYIMFDPTFIVEDLLIGLKDFAKIVVFEEFKVKKIIMIFRGIADGMFGKVGIFVDKTIASESARK